MSDNQFQRDQMASAQRDIEEPGQGLTDSAPPSPQCICEVTSRTLGYQVVTRIKTACPKHGAKLGVCMCGHYHDGDCRECGCDCWTIPLIPDGQISFEPAPASPAPHDTLQEAYVAAHRKWVDNMPVAAEFGRLMDVVDSVLHADRVRAAVAALSPREGAEQQEEVS